MVLEAVASYRVRTPLDEMAAEVPELQSLGSKEMNFLKEVLPGLSPLLITIYYYSAGTTIVSRKSAGAPEQMDVSSQQKPSSDESDGQHDDKPVPTAGNYDNFLALWFNVISRAWSLRDAHR
ncbi:hypothetical protein F2Q68_00011675 [Brassica cretica]|uniref:Uncharacterized protein n=1 Tax=Brassica cretica TaxID=69181 RepID=A0A8S9L012_BRACR|nr:hypothetical protein F2Q68_00011675 [Brassica cretica]